MSFLKFTWYLLMVNMLSGLPAIAYYLFFMKNKDRISRIIFFIVLVSFLSNFSTYFFIKYVIKNSYVISNVFVIIDFYLCAYLFSLILPKLKKIILGLVAFFTICGLVSLFFFSFLHPNPVTSTIRSLSIIFLSVSTFYNMLKTNSTNRLVFTPIFWVVCGIFFYNASSLLDNLFSDYLVFTLNIQSEPLMYMHIYSIVCDLLKNLFFFFYAFILVNKGFPIQIIQPKQEDEWLEY